MSKTQQRTAKELTALIAFCEDMKKVEDANRELCIGYKSLEKRNEHFQARRYFSKKEKELKVNYEQLINHGKYDKGFNGGQVFDPSWDIGRLKMEPDTKR
nr:MAG TPA: hypothetical protein [Caudoviricetes sp.]